MWREFFQRYSSECKFSIPASQNGIDDIEKSLGIEFPVELRSLLQETNGVYDQYGCSLIWSIERIKTNNLKFRNHSDFKDLYMPFDHLLFFADAGNGDQFAYAILNGVIRGSNIYVWNHEDDSRTWKAPSLEKYIEWLLSGKLKV